MCWNGSRRLWVAAGGAVLLGALAWAGGLSAGGDSRERISSVSDLGLGRADVPVSTETKVVFLVNPALNRAQELGEALGAAAPGPERSDGRIVVPFDQEEIAALTAPGRPGNTAAYEAVGDVAEQFFRFMFTQVPYTERSLHRIVQEVKRQDFPLAVVDAAPRLVTRPGGGDRVLETTVTVRLYMIHVEGDRERDLRWVTRCELCFEDAAVGRAALPRGRKLPSALAETVVDALRGKIAHSFAFAPILRRASGRIDEPRRELIERSISEAGESPPPAAPAASPAVSPAASPAPPPAATSSAGPRPGGGT